MKIRWTENSIRFRITPTELNTLLAGRSIVETLRLPGQGWSAEIAPVADSTDVSMRANGRLEVRLGTGDLKRLADPAEEGVYFTKGSDAAFKYLIEKDFPCIHPRAAEAAEPSTETFQPPTGFESKE